MTLKVHVIMDHYGYYFQKTGLTFKDTNSEFTESAHRTVRKFEEAHNFKVVRKLGSPTHLRRSLDSISQFNSKNLGVTTPERLWKKSPPHIPSLSPLVINFD